MRYSSELEVLVPQDDSVLSGARSEVVVRQSTPADTDSAWRCLDTVARERRWLSMVEAPPIEHTRYFLKTPGLIQFVAVCKDEVIGWCDVTPKPHEGMQHCAVLGMGLLPDYRGHGLGRQLVQQVLQAVRDAGLTRIELDVFESNVAAIRLYERLGFAHEGRKRAARMIDGRTEDILCMALVNPAVDPDPPQPYSEQFIERVLDPASWEEKARALLAAAEPLAARVPEFWDRVRSGTSGAGWRDEFVAIYFMLAGLAVENLLKARLVLNHRDDLERHLRSRHRLPKLLDEHDLHRLARRAGLRSLMSAEEGLLRRLTRSVVWYARYPVPARAADLERLVRSRSTEGDWISLSQLSSTDVDDIERLVRALSR